MPAIATVTGRGSVAGVGRAHMSLAIAGVDWSGLTCSSVGGTKTVAGQA